MSLGAIVGELVTQLQVEVSEACCCCLGENRNVFAVNIWTFHIILP